MNGGYFDGPVAAVVVDDAVVGRIFSEGEGPGIGLALFQTVDETTLRRETFAIPADVASYIAHAFRIALGEEPNDTTLAEDVP